MKKLNLLFSTGIISMLFASYAVAQWEPAAAPKTYLQAGWSKVGIGTTAPVSKLHVAGTTGLDLNTAHGLMVLGNKTSFNLAFDARDIQARNNGTGATLYQNFYGGDVQLGPTANPFIYKAANGGVGIGTASPVSKLQVTSSSVLPLDLNADGLLVLGNKTGYNIAFGQEDIQARHNGSGSTLFQNYYGGNVQMGPGAKSLFYRYADGYVGVGLNNPISKFQVSGSESSAHGKNTAIEISNTSSLGANWYLRAGANGTVTPAKGFSIADDNGYRLVIDSVGFIGVGTIAPAFYFDVEGAITGPFAGAGIIHAKVNAPGMWDRIAIKAESEPAIGHGIGVEAHGGFIGVSGTVENNNSPNAFFGGSFFAGGSGSVDKIGVIGVANGGSGNDWGVYSNGNAYANGFWMGSDARFKKDIELLQHSMEKIMQLKPSSYFFKTDEYIFMSLPREKQEGFIAQDLENVFPEMVREIHQPLMDKGVPTRECFTFKGVNYDKMIPVLVAALQEEHLRNNKLEDKNQVLEQKVNEMQQCLETLCNQNLSSSKSEGASIINSATENMLYQNQPNPFNQSTVIQYQLSKDSKSAQILIRDLSGNLLKSIPVTGAEKETIINANEFVQGTYTYTLVVNNRSIDTKLMVITK
ncbi:MAG: tail fiber domain-containing protein [Bacteroidia bacterium]